MSRTSRAAAFLAFAAVALATTAAAADPQPHGTVTDVNRHQGSVDFVFSVAGLPSGAHIDPSSITVTADGRTLTTTAAPVGTSRLARAATVREVVLAIDVSGSMSGDGIAAARDAAVSYASGLPSDVRVGLLTFSDTPHLLLQPTTDRHALAAAVAHLRAGGDTALYDGALAAVKELQGTPANAQRRLVVLSDGVDTASTHHLSDVVTALRADHVAADVVAFRIPGNTDVLHQIADASHGRVLPASDAAGLAAAFTMAANAFVPELRVHSVVPAALAHHATTLHVSGTSGSTAIAAAYRITLPAASSAAVAAGSAGAGTAAPGSNTRLLIALALAFVALLTVFLMVFLLPGLRRERARRAARLEEVNRYRIVSAMDAVRAAGADATAEDEQSTTALTEHLLALVDRGVRARGRREKLVHELERAGLRMRPEEWAALHGAAFVVPAAVLGVVTSSLFGALAGAVVGLFGIRFYIRRRIRRRADQFITQLPDSLQLLASSLRSGLSFEQGLNGIVREGSEPVASEFARALTEARLGATLEDALDAVAERMSCLDLQWVVTAIRISREVGGNLAEVLMTTVSTMRQRAEVRGQIQVLSAEGRISAKVLIGLPFVIGGLLSVINPGYFSPMFHTGLGWAMIAAGAVFMGLGAFWISRLVKIEV